MAEEIAIYGNRDMIDSQKGFVNTLGVCHCCRFGSLELRMIGEICLSDFG